MKQVKGLLSGEELQEYRIKKGLTQLEFAKKIKQTPSYVSMIEIGIKAASRFYIQKIATAFKEEFVIKISPNH